MDPAAEADGGPRGGPFSPRRRRGRTPGGLGAHTCRSLILGAILLGAMGAKKFGPGARRAQQKEQERREKLYGRLYGGEGDARAGGAAGAVDSAQLMQLQHFLAAQQNAQPGQGKGSGPVQVTGGAQGLNDADRRAFALWLAAQQGAGWVSPGLMQQQGPAFPSQSLGMHSHGNTGMLLVVVALGAVVVWVVLMRALRGLRPRASSIPEASLPSTENQIKGEEGEAQAKGKMPLEGDSQMAHEIAPSKHSGKGKWRHSEIEMEAGELTPLKAGEDDSVESA